MKFRRFAVIFSVLVLQGVAVYLFVKPPPAVTDAVNTQNIDGRVSSAEFQKQRQKDGGLPGHRKRIDDFIEIVSGMDFGQCSMALHAAPTSRDGFDAVQVSTITPMIEPVGQQGTVSRIFADRRAAKMYEILQKEDTERARSMVLTLFETKLKQHVDFFKREIARFDSNERTDSGKGGIFISQGTFDMANLDFTGKDYGPGAKYECATLNHHALTVSLFLVSCFCSPDEFLEKADEWDRTMAPIVGQIMNDLKYRLLIGEAMCNGIPDPLLVCNLMLMVASRADGGGEAQAEEVLKWPELADELHRGKPRIVSFYKWDAETNASDFTHIHAFVPATESAVLARFAVVRRWDLGLRLDESLKQEFYQKLKTRFILELGL